jgi:hypothetical protein
LTNFSGDQFTCLVSTQSGHFEKGFDSFNSDYIVVHELCHLHHANHTDAFWNEVDKVLPDYKKRYECLKHNGAGLDIGLA